MLNSSNPRTSEVASDQKLSLETSKTSEVTSDPRVFRLQVTPKLEVTSDPSRSILHTMAGRLQMFGHRSRKPRIPGFARSGVAVVLRWSGQWSQSMVRGLWSGRWYGPVVQLAVRSVVRSVDRWVVWLVVWWMVQFVVRSVRSVIRSNTSCSIQWPGSFKCSGYWSRDFCSFATFVILRSPDPGPRTLCPQDVVRAACWRSL